MTEQRPGEAALYRRWILANGWAEAAGLGTTFAVGHAVAPHLGAVTGVAAVLGGALLAVLSGVVLEGLVVGWAQARVLTRATSAVDRRGWIVATAAGAGLAWTLGMIPSTAMALREVGAAAPGETAPMQEPGALVQLALAVALGAVTGPILGLAQWVVLRRAVARAGSWLTANAMAWAVGMPVIFAGMDRVPWDGPRWAIVVALYAVTAVAGLVVGAIHGRVLLALLRSRVAG